VTVLDRVTTKWSVDPQMDWPLSFCLPTTSNVAELKAHRLGIVGKNYPEPTDNAGTNKKAEITPSPVQQGVRHIESIFFR